MSLGWLYQDSVSQYILNARVIQPIEPPPIKYVVPPEPVIKIQPVEIPEEPPPEIPETSVEDLVKQLVEPLSALSPEETWIAALKAVFHLWEEPWLEGSEIPPGDLPESSKLEIFEVFGNQTVLKAINYPAILELKIPKDHSIVYVALKKFTDNGMVLVGQEEMDIPAEVLTGLWYGRAFVFWKDFEKLPRSIYPGTRGDTVLWLQKNLKILGLFEGPESGVYDDRTVDAVVRLQKENNLFADGILGPQTKRTLYSLLDVYPKPTLVGSE